MQMSPPSICSPVTIGDNSRIIPAGDICCLKLICKPDFHRTIGRERRERVSQLAWCGEGCFDSRRRVNSSVMLLTDMTQVLHRFVIVHLLIALWSCVALAQSSNNQPIAEVPFAFDHTSVIIQVKVNGKGPFNMVLDTGSDVATIDLATAKDLGLNLKPTGQQASGGGSEKSQIFLTQIPQVEIGGLASKDIVSVVVDLSKSSQALGK